MIYEELFIEAMENAWLCTPERNDDGSINVEETINSYQFEAGCSCREWGWLCLKSVLRAIQDADLNHTEQEFYDEFNN